MNSYNPLRWGILSTGWIATSFAGDLAGQKDHVIAAVGSRTAESAEKFGAQFGIKNRHASYKALVNDSEVDIVYVATPHPMHFSDTMLALEAGKHVLVEKPFAMDARESSEMIALAQKKKLFLMEAMWTRFLPHIHRVRAILSDGTLGRITTVMADHGQCFAENAESRWFAPSLGGGALLDLGIYPVSFASMVLGTPSRITAVNDKAFTGVDAQTSVLLQYKNGEHAVLTTTLQAASPNTAVIVGTEARLEIDRVFYTPSSFRVIKKDGTVSETFDNTYKGHGLREEAIEAARCIRLGLKESPLLPLSETLSIMKTMDEIRKQIGLTY